MQGDPSGMECFKEREVSSTCGSEALRRCSFGTCEDDGRRPRARFCLLSSHRRDRDYVVLVPSSSRELNRALFNEVS